MGSAKDHEKEMHVEVEPDMSITHRSSGVKEWRRGVSWNFLGKVTKVSQEHGSQSMTSNDEAARARAQFHMGDDEADPEYLLRKLNQDYDVKDDHLLTRKCQKLSKELDSLRKQKRANRQEQLDRLAKLYEPTHVSLKWGSLAE